MAMAKRQDGTVSICPGLNGLGCGEARKKGQSYCPTHNRQYQRERYAGVRRGAGLDYTSRDYTQVETDQACGACGGVFKEGLLTIHGFTLELPMICRECRAFLEANYKDRTFSRLMAIAHFLVDHEELLSSTTAVSKEFQAEVIRRYDAWYDTYLAPYGIIPYDEYFDERTKAFSIVLQKEYDAQRKLLPPEHNKEIDVKNRQDDKMKARGERFQAKEEKRYDDAFETVTALVDYVPEKWGPPTTPPKGAPSYDDED